MEETWLRSMWQFASVCQFLHTFYDCFIPSSSNKDISDGFQTLADSGYPDSFETETLETTLLGGPPIEWLRNLHVRLLRFLTKNRFVTEDTWLMYLGKEFEKRAHEFEDVEGGIPFVYQEDVQYYDLPVKTRVLILYYLCEWQLDKSDQIKLVIETSESEAVEWRVEPIGYDAKGNTYWLFDDNRLYVEYAPTVPKKIKSKKKGSRKRKSSVKSEPLPIDEDGDEGEENIEKSTPNVEEPPSNWSLVCSTVQEWREFPKQFEGSRNAAEKEFYAYLQEHVLDPVIEALAEKERNMKMREKLANRKRSSRLISKLQTRTLDIPQESTVIDNEGHRRSGRQLQEKTRIQSEEDSKPKEDMREKRRLERELRMQQQMELERLKFEREQIAQLLAIQKQSPAQSPSANPVDTKPFNDVPSDALSQSLSAKKRKKEDPGEPASAKKKKKTKEPRSNDDWVFDCTCGIKKRNYDDGQPSVSCEKCNRWKHISCVVKDLGLDPALGQAPAAWENREFVCKKCLDKKSRKKSSIGQAPLSDTVPISVSSPDTGNAVHSSFSKPPLVSSPSASLLTSPSKIKITLGPVPQVIVSPQSPKAPTEPSTVIPASSPSLPLVHAVSGSVSTTKPRDSTMTSIVTSAPTSVPATTSKTITSKVETKISPIITVPGAPSMVPSSVIMSPLLGLQTAIQSPTSSSVMATTGSPPCYLTSPGSTNVNLSLLNSPVGPA